ncbi:MAG: hypothetical protein HOP18_25790 [Deltaproteobacteria bacterium]|nr:hypothetical protein [Deltaproteobacteria bacterium]
MTRQFVTLFTTAALCTMLTGRAVANSPTVNMARDKVIAQLEQKAHRFEWEAQATKGVPRALRDLQRLRVRQLIQQLQTGEAVDPQEIDKLLHEQPWPG